MPYIALATLAVSAYQTYKSSEDKKKAENALSNLKHTNYQVSPELRGAYDRAQQMARFGYTPQEKAALRQNVAQDINTNQQRALDQGGGNLARTISRMGSIANVQSENQMAMNDAGLHRQNIRYADSLGGQIQGINNMATGEDISQYNKAESAYGQAAAQQQENIYRAMGNAVGAGAYYQNRQDAKDPSFNANARINPYGTPTDYSKQWGTKSYAPYQLEKRNDDYYRFGIPR